MDTIYLVSLLVGGFFVVLSLLGGTDSDTDVDHDFDHDVDTDFDHDFDHDLGHDFDTHVEADVDHDLGHDFSSGPGLVDLLSIRALFLFAAFFGLTGIVLSWLGSGEPLTSVLAVLTGLVVGLGGNYFIKRVGYEHVSSNVSEGELKGLTGKVLVPFEGDRRGKITLVAKGHRLQLLARSLDEASPEPFEPGEEVVVVRMNGSVAEVVKPT